MGAPAYPAFPNSPQVTAESIFQAARALLVGNQNDTTVFSDAILQPYFNLAYPELTQIMSQCQTNRVRREFYYVVPAFTSVVNPLAIGVYDMDEPELMWERQSITIIPIATTGKNSPIQVTTQIPHNLGPNTEINCGGTIGTTAVQGRWFVTVIDPLNVTLNGSVSDGNAGIGGNIYQSGNYFQEVYSDDQSGQNNSPMNQYLNTYRWEESVFKFRGATNPSEIKVRYWINGNPPQNVLTPLGIEGCFQYLAYRIAGKAAEAKGWLQMADRYINEAVGPKREADATGGLLRGFLNSQVLRMQRQQYRRQPFRVNTSSIYGFNDYPYGTPSFGGPGATTNPAVSPVVRTGWYPVPFFNGFSNVDLTQGDTQYILLTTDTAILNYPSPVAFSYRFVIDQDAIGGHAVEWGSRYLGLNPGDWSGAGGIFAGSGIAPNTRVIIQFSIDLSGNSVVTGAITGPSPATPL
jgi:hypothetical protein